MIKRYEIDTGYYGSGYRSIESEYGDWCRVDDVEELEAKLAALEAENAKLREAMGGPEND